jgi:hypothetical protein
MKSTTKKITIPGVGKLLEHKSRAALDANKITLEEHLKAEEWAKQTLDENKEMLKEQMREEFLNLVVYGHSKHVVK